MNPAERLAIYERDGGLCGFCGLAVPRERFHVDHTQPKGLGGADSDENYRVAHRRCNIAAGAQVVRERRRRGMPTYVEEAMAQGEGRVTVSFRMPVVLLEQLQVIANDEDRSLNAQVARALREWLAQYAKSVV
jgi:hypothetical protein